MQIYFLSLPYLTLRRVCCTSAQYVSGNWKPTRTHFKLHCEKLICISSKPVFFFFYNFKKNKFIYFIYFFLAVLGLRCCVRAFSSCGKRELLFLERASHCGGFSCCGAWALGMWASVVVAHGLSSCGSQALELRLSSCGARA